MQTYLLIALGGAAGANARFVASTLVASRWGTRLPWWTLLINVTGSFLLGLFLAMPTLGTGAGRALLATGFCGGYTTFSTFAYETFQLVRDGSWGLALVNVVVSAAAGFFAVVLAVKLAGLAAPRP